MTSVLSHRQPLSGSNKVIVFILLVFFIASCSTTTEVVRPERDTTVTRDTRKRPADTKVDTVQWTEVDAEDFQPIEYDGTPRIEKESLYRAALLVPFNARNYNEGVNSSDEERFIQFYAGARLGLDDLQKEGVSLVLDVYDTEGSEATLKSKLRNIDDDTHLIIGPYERNLLRSAAQFAKDNEIPLVSPWQSSSRIAEENPFYLQLRPSLRDHYDKMVEAALRRFKAEQIIILKKEDGSDDNRVDYLQQVGKSLLRTELDPFMEYPVNSDSLILGETYFMDLFSEESETVFLIQNYSFDDEDFVYNSLRKLSAAKGLRSATVYGLPILLDTEKIDFNLYKIMNVKVVRSRFVDPNSDSVKAFRKGFFDRYGALPSEEAYYGYDIISYFGNALKKFGKQFQFFLDQHSDDLLQINFDIQKTYLEGGTVSDDFRDINYFINKHLDIIEFEENKFKVARRN